MMLVAGAEEARGAAKQALAALVPADAAAGLECVGNLGLVEECRLYHIAHRPHEDRAFIVSEYQSLLRRH